MDSSIEFGKWWFRLGFKPIAPKTENIVGLLVSQTRTQLVLDLPS